MRANNKKISEFYFASEEPNTCIFSLIKPLG